jgi:DNA repair protein SbcC/Rad50
MRPHRLRVTAFGAFGGTVEVCFDDLASAGVFLLHGETGAGKTTLLDAIGFALYGRVPGERGKTRRLRSDHARPDTATEVQLELTIGGRRMRITRKPEQERPKRRGSGTTSEPAKILLEEQINASWHPVSTRAGEADDEIKDLMGMSADQFFQVVLLPQGQFAQFLHADAKDRERLLQKLFGTDRFHAVEDWLAERRRTTARAVEEAEHAVGELIARVAQAADVPPPDPEGSEVPGGPGGTEGSGDPEDPAAWATQLAESAAAESAATAAQAAVHGRDLDAALARQRDTERLAGHQRRRLDALRTQEDLAAARPHIDQQRYELAAAARAAEAAPALAEAERTAATLVEARTEETQARTLAKAASHATAAELRAEGQQHVAQVGRLDALHDLSRQAEDEDRIAVTATAAAAKLTARIAALQQEAGTRRRQRPELTDDRDQARDAAAKLPSVQAAADLHRRAADDADALVKAHIDARRQEQAYLAARMRTADLRDLALRLREARIDGMRAELAATLTDGAPCPVCGSLDHPELCELRGDRVTREQEEAADADAAAAADQAEMTGAKLAAADILVADLTARLQEAGFTIPADLAGLQATATGLAATARDLKAESARLTETATRLGDLQDALDTLDEDIAAADKRLAELTEQRESELRQATEADQRSQRHRASLQDQLGGAPDLDFALEEAREAADALNAAAEAADATARAQADAQRAAAQATKSATEAGFADLDAVRGALRIADWRAAADQAIRDHEASTKAVDELLADPDLDVALEPPADLPGATTEVEAARKQHDDAVAARDRATHKAEQLADLAPKLAASLDELRPLAARAAQARGLADLAAGNGANTLRMTLSSFVLAARLEEVAAAASARLLTMTSGRYSLVHTDARRGGGRSGLGLLACDTWTGVDRDTSTLSGGETFLASLSLALGLADVVTAEAGGTRIEALFVDEGFGSLDEETLEEVMTVLDGLREGGRMVGIVSHVAELRQRIPAQIRVHKAHAGSHLTVRAPAG